MAELENLLISEFNNFLAHILNPTPEQMKIRDLVNSFLYSMFISYYGAKFVLNLFDRYLEKKRE